MRHASAESGPLFAAEGLRKHYGGLVAVDGFDITLNRGQIVALIGPNGAGKTTAFNLITGMDRPDAGRAAFRGRDITGLPAHRVARLGIARTFQNTRLPPHLTVLDNVRVACHKHIGYGLVGATLRLPNFHRREREATRRAMQLLDMFGLGPLAGELAGALPYGQRRYLEIVRALATEAELLLLDEPAAGLNPSETCDLSGLIRRIRDEFGLTILLIEHDMRMVMSLCEWIVVLDYGKVIARGAPEQIRRDPAVIEAYLGRPDEDKPTS